VNYRTYLPAFLRALPLWQHVVGLVVVVAVVVLGARYIFTPSSAADVTQDAGVPRVHLASVGELASQAGPLSIVGTVKSRSEATILAETSGQITSLTRSIGDRVVAGSVIGQFENASQRAAVTQAQGAYDAAQAALQKLQGSTAANTSINSAQASTAAQNAATSLQTALRSAYATLDDAVRTKADTLFSNPTSASPIFLNYTVPDSQLVSNIQNGRVRVNAVLSDASAVAQSASTASFDTRVASMLDDAHGVQDLLDNLIAAMNQAVPNGSFSAATIAANQTMLSAARTSVLGAVSSVTAAKTAYDAANAGAQTAANSATQGSASDVASAQASLKSAQGALDAARANLDKTIIRSPISGTIVSMPVTSGDFVSNFAQIAIVSNPGALYVELQVTPDDAKTIAVGNAAMVEGMVTGTITFVAPALDPATGKIQVKVGLTGSQASLTDGEAVSVSLNRNASSVTVQKNQVLAIPIVAVKVTPAGPIVFLLTASSTLAAQSVQLGTILGDKVVVSGISPDTQIVTDARGHSIGEQVIVETSASF